MATDAFNWMIDYGVVGTIFMYAYYYFLVMMTNLWMSFMFKINEFFFDMEKKLQEMKDE